MELARGLGRPRLPHRHHRAASEPQPIKGLYDPGDENGRTRATAEHRWMIYDVDFQTGKIRWEHELAPGRPESPASHQEQLCLRNAGHRWGAHLRLLRQHWTAAALDLNGRRVWMQELGAYDGRQAFGTAASPALHGDRVIVVHDNITESFMAAYDKRTGKELWRVKRDEVENWATPFVWENELRTEIVTSGLRKVRSYDLNGKELWSCRA